MEQDANDSPSAHRNRSWATCAPDRIPAKTQRAPLSPRTAEDARPRWVEGQQLTPRLQAEGAGFDPGLSGAGAGCRGHSAAPRLSRCSSSDNKPRGEDTGPDLPPARCPRPCSPILRPGLGPGNAATEERGPLSRPPSQHQTWVGGPDARLHLRPKHFPCIHGINFPKELLSGFDLREPSISPENRHLSHLTL